MLVLLRRLPLIIIVTTVKSGNSMLIIVLKSSCGLLDRIRNSGKIFFIHLKIRETRQWTKEEIEIRKRKKKH